MARTRLLLSLLVILANASSSGELRAASPSVLKENQRLAEAVSAITKADYQGDREELKRQAEALATQTPKANAKYWEYWRGFAYWRRGINGSNEEPKPADLLSDFENCAARARAALAIDPAFEDARSALTGCLAWQLSVVPADSERGKEIIRDAMSEFKTVQERGADNPRSLWIVGGLLSRQDATRAADAFRRGLAASRKEAASAKGRDPWVPAWGAPENLMMLAYTNVNGKNPNKDVARAYAEGALAMVPDWHFVRDILLPQIEKLPDAKP